MATPGTPRTPAPGRDTPRSRTLARPSARAGQSRRAEAVVLDPAAAPPTAPDGAKTLIARGLGATERIVAVVVVLVLLLASSIPSVVVYFNQQRQLIAVRQEIADRQAEIEAMRSEIARWQDPAYVAAQARERLGWVVPGETGYVVLGPDGQPVGGASVSAGAKPTAGGPPTTWYQLLWDTVRTADDPKPG